MSNQQITHCGFSDESSWNDGRYRSIAMVSGTVAALKTMEDELKDVFSESKEIKWKGLKSAEKIQAAMRMIRIAGNCAAAGKCRVDTLIWDVEDSRHAVQGRDDSQNLKRMYYHLFKNVLQEIWPSNSTWAIAPDEHDQLDWRSLEYFLTAVSMKSSTPNQKSLPGAYGSGYRNRFNIKKIKPVQSQKYRLTQLADLFAGVSVFFVEQSRGLPIVER